MFQFFQSVANIFTTVVDYIIGVFELLLNLVKLIFKAQAFLIRIIQSLPPFLIVFFYRNRIACDSLPNLKQGELIYLCLENF